MLAYPDNVLSRQSLPASGITDASLVLNVFHSGVERSLSLSELKKTSARAFNVLQYGADPTGLTDSTTKFDAAINAAVTASGILYVPAGTYSLDTWTTDKFITSDLTIVGDGKDVVTIQGPSTLDTFVYMMPSGSIKINGVGFTRWSEVVFVGSNSGGIDHEQLIIDNCLFYDLLRPIQDTGNTLVTGFKEFRFTNSKILNCNDGVRLRAATIRFAEISSNIIDTLSNISGCNGISIGGNSTTGCEYVIVDKNNIRDITSSGSSVETHGINVYGRGIIVTNNRLENIENANGTSSEGLYTKSQNCIVSSNVLINAGAGEGSLIIKGNNKGDTSSPLGYASIVSNNTVIEESTGDVTNIYVARNDCVVSGNVVQGGRKGISVTTGSNISITGNTIIDSTSSTGSGSCIRLQDCSGILINGNVLKNWANYGIHIRTTTGTPKDFTVIGNRIDTITTPGYGLYMECSVPLSGLIIKDNHIRDAIIGIAFDSGGTNILKGIIADNIFTSTTTAIGYYLNGSIIKYDNIVDGSKLSTISGTSPIKTTTDVMKTNNVSPTTMTGISGGMPGDHVFIIIGDANTTVDFTGSTLVGNSGVDWIAASGGSMSCVYDGAYWYCQVSNP